MNKSTILCFIIGMIVGALLLLFVAAVSAANLTPTPNTIKFCDVCPGFTVSRRGNDVLIRCPGKPLDQPWMTFKDCLQPKVVRTPGNVAITCNWPTNTASFIPPLFPTEEVLLNDDRLPGTPNQPLPPILMACAKP